MTTDRAKRYAANRNVADDKRGGCLFCGSKRFLTVDHLDGDPGSSEAANLAYLCKSCNTRKGAAFRKAGIGRPTNQYNPRHVIQHRWFATESEARAFVDEIWNRAWGVEMRRVNKANKRYASGYTVEWYWRKPGEKPRPDAIFKDNQYNPYLGLSPQERKNFEQMGFDFYSPAGRVGASRASRTASAEERRRKAARLAELHQRRTLKRRAEAQALYDSGRRMNPGTPLKSAAQWSEAVRAVLGGPSTISVRAAASRIRATPPGQRRKLAASMRPNPGRVPTYEQYAFAVSGYNHGKGDPALSEIIHRTPKAKRAEYARRIGNAKKEHGTEHMTGTYRTAVPF